MTNAPLLKGHHLRLTMLLLLLAFRLHASWAFTLTGMTQLSRHGPSFLSRRDALASGILSSSALLSRPLCSHATMVSLPDDAYSTLGGEMKYCRVLTGMWQVGGAHGYVPQTDQVLDAMRGLATAGFTTFDLADIYGPAEQFVGAFTQANDSSKLQFFTKYVPRATRMTQSMVNDAIGRSISRMKATQLDLVQFHWWDYDSPYYMDALQFMQDMVGEGKIRHLGLTNFDTDHLEYIVDKGINIVSNQVQYSVVDTRPGVHMAKLCADKNIAILSYGTLLGGFLSEKWLNRAPPAQFETVSLQKYFNMIRAWGGWELFQELLVVCKSIADKHGVSIANVGVRWVLDQPAVGGAIVGNRLGYTSHVQDTTSVFKFTLDADDLGRIKAVQSKGRDLMKIIGDCGDEYRA